MLRRADALTVKDGDPSIAGGQESRGSGLGADFNDEGNPLIAGALDPTEERAMLEGVRGSAQKRQLEKLRDLAADTMAGSYDSAKAAAAALHDNDTLRAYAEELGSELWAVIDKKTFAIKNIGIGTSGDAEGVFQHGSGFSPGDSVWHTHPSGKMVWRGDLESIVASNGRWIFASGNNLSGIDVYTTGYTRRSQVLNDFGRGSVTRHIYENDTWREELYKF